MTPAQPPSVRALPVRALLTLLLLVAALTAASSALAAPPATATDPAATDPGAPVASTASTPDAGLATTDAVTGTGGSPATPADPTAATAAPADPASAPTPAITDGGATSAPGSGAQNDIRPQSPVLVPGAADTPISHPSHYSAASSSRGVLGAPIVSLSGRTPVPPKASLTQLASDGPLVNSSGSATASRARHAAAPPAAPPLNRSLNGPLFSGPSAPRNGVPPISVSVPIAGVFIGSQAVAAHHPGARSAAAPRVGPSGLPHTIATKLGHGPAMHAGAMVILGNAPASSGGGGASPLLGLDTMLAAMLVIVAIVWSRRSWDLPTLQGESALFSLALDRPG